LRLSKVSFDLEKFFKYRQEILELTFVIDLF